MIYVIGTIHEQKKLLLLKFNGKLGVDSCLGGRLSGRLCLFVLFRFGSCNLACALMFSVLARCYFLL
jgi:hypothetical protein